MIDGPPCKRLQRPWLWLPSQVAHDLSPWLLPSIANLLPVKNAVYRRFEWEAMEFRNPLGIAGGVDKSGTSLLAWQKLGAGFLEVGTITPRPQAPNAGRIMARNLAHWALWNKMGFPNPGAHAVNSNLQKFLPHKVIPLFVNIGKNRDTANELAFKDYMTCMDILASAADAFVINVSSPNTKGLRDLQSRDFLLKFLAPIVNRREQICAGTPLLLKLSPDLAKDELQELIVVSSPLVEGWIITNTTQQRPLDLGFPRDGGLSGLPLQNLARQSLRWVTEVVGENTKNKLMVSVGGIIDAFEVRKRLQMGAHLVQSYSGLVFQGPGFFRQSLNTLRS